MDGTMNEGFWGGGDGFIVLILFLLLIGGGGVGGLFGGGNAAAQGALTRAEMQDGFNNAEIQRNQVDILGAVNGTGRDILENRYTTATGLAGIDKSIMENRFAAQLGNQSMQAQMAQCCCDIKTAVHQEGELTRSMIQSQTIEDLKSQLNLAQIAAANATQSQNLLNAMGRFTMNPPVNPYGCGC